MPGSEHSLGRVGSEVRDKWPWDYAEEPRAVSPETA